MRPFHFVDCITTQRMNEKCSK